MAGAGGTGQAGRGHRPSCLERSVAAATASMNADRTALNSRVRNAAAVVPPGEVTAARSSPGSSPGLRHHPGRAEHGVHHQSLAHVAGEAGGHPALDHGLGHQVDVGRARTGHPGHRVEVALGQPDHRPHRSEDPLGPVEIGRRRRAAAGDGGHPAPDQRGGVGHRSHHHSGPEGGLEAGRRESGHDRQDPVDPDGGQGAEHRLGQVGLHGQQSAVGGDRGVHHRQTGMGTGQTLALDRVGIAHRQIRNRRPARGDQAGQQGRTHLPAPDHQQFRRHGLRRYQRPDRPPRPLIGIRRCAPRQLVGLNPMPCASTAGAAGTGPRSRAPWPSGSTRRCRPARPP